MEVFSRASVSCSFHDDADIKREATLAGFLIKPNNGHLCQAIPLSTILHKQNHNHPPTPPAYSVNISCSLLSSCGVVTELVLVIVVCICLYVSTHVYEACVCVWTCVVVHILNLNLVCTQRVNEIFEQKKYVNLNSNNTNNSLT